MLLGLWSGFWGWGAGSEAAARKRRRQREELYQQFQDAIEPEETVIAAKPKAKPKEYEFTAPVVLANLPEYDETDDLILLMA